MIHPPTLIRRPGIQGDADWIDWITDLENTIGHSVDGALALVNDSKREQPCYPA